MFRFGSPYYLFLLLLAGAVAYQAYRRRVTQGILFSRAGRIAVTGTSWRVALNRFVPGLYVLGLGLCIVALARPQTVLSQAHKTADVVSMEMVVDVSGSMEALDLSDIVGNRIAKERTRLDVVKEMFAKFIEQRPDDLIGLVTFGGYASTRAPLTADHDALLHLLKGVVIPRTRQGTDGQVVQREELMTAVGDALATACARLRDADTRSRIVILLSDGESNTGIIKPEDAIKAAESMGIKVYTIGVGSNGQAPMKGIDLFGREVLQMVQVSLDEGLLKSAAERTGGTYFNVRDPKGLAQALASIDELEKTKVEKSLYQHFEELFPYLLWPGLGLVALASTLSMVLARRTI